MYWEPIPSTTVETLEVLPLESAYKKEWAPIIMSSCLTLHWQCQPGQYDMKSNEEVSVL